jgi:hypothetical protein
MELSLQSFLYLIHSTKTTLNYKQQKVWHAELKTLKLFQPETRKEGQHFATQITKNSNIYAHMRAFTHTHTHKLPTKPALQLQLLRNVHWLTVSKGQYHNFLLFYMINPSGFWTHTAWGKTSRLILYPELINAYLELNFCMHHMYLYMFSLLLTLLVMANVLLAPCGCTPPQTVVQVRCHRSFLL